MSKIDQLVDKQIITFYNKHKDVYPRYITVADTPIDILLDKVDWIERNKVKREILFKSLKLQVLFVLCSQLFIVLPYWIANEQIGKSIFLSMFPVWIMTLSWMLGCWYFWDKGKYLYMAMTFGMIPVRMVVCLCWVLFSLQTVPELVFSAYVFGLMLYWVLFTVGEIFLALKISKIEKIKVKEPGW